MLWDKEDEEGYNIRRLLMMIREDASLVLSDVVATKEAPFLLIVLMLHSMFSRQ
jgi:hypothetical protein